MAEFPATYTAEEVANATGNPVGDYTDFIDEAIDQAILLFGIATCLPDDQWPDSARDAKMARLGILHMADAIFWAQPWQKVLRNPFSSETIGSYSYSKLTSAVSAGLPTGISWFDIATTKLSICDVSNGPSHGGWLVHEENKTAEGGYGVFLGPADQTADTWATLDTFDPSGA